MVPGADPDGQEPPLLIDMATHQRHVVAGDSFTIGRSRAADLVLDSPRISRQHAMLRRDEEGAYLFFDLNSSNGSWVDGKQVTKPQPLRDGSQIRLGPFGFTFHVFGGLDPPPPASELRPDATMVLVDRQPMVFVVADIHRFTSLSEGLKERAVADLLGPWYDRCRGLVEGQSGAVDKFIGDSVFAYWSGLAADTHAAAAACAESLARSLDDLPGFKGARLGVALHSGSAALSPAPGGAHTPLGEAVNLTFRLETLTREVPHSILASADFRERCPEPLAERFTSLGMHPLKGFRKQFEVYALT